MSSSKNMKELEKQIKKRYEQILLEKEYEVACPKCGYKFNATKGDVKCNQCGNVFKFDLTVEY